MSSNRPLGLETEVPSELTSSGPEKLAPKNLKEQAHSHSGWFCCIDNVKVMVDRIKNDECVLVFYSIEKRTLTESLGLHFDTFVGPALGRTGWCLTHSVEANYGHQQDVLRQERERRARG